MSSKVFLDTHPVFTVAEAMAEFSPGQRKPTLDRLHYHAREGRVKAIARGVYAAVPRGYAPERFQPDRYLAAAAIRPDGVLSHHAALELLGAAHSDWNVCTVLTDRPRAAVMLDGVTLRFLAHPSALARRGCAGLGCRTLDRLGRSLRVSGPERTLVDGFGQPGLVGGLPELVESAGGFGVLDLDLLREILRAYDTRNLFAAVGWFLERFQSQFFVPDGFLAELEGRRPASPQYLPRRERGGRLVQRWNLVLPESVVAGAEPDEPWS